MHPHFFPESRRRTHPPLDVATEELGLGDVYTVPGHSQLELLRVLAGVTGLTLAGWERRSLKVQYPGTIGPTPSHVQHVNITSHQGLQQQCVKVIRSLLLAAIDGDQVLILIDSEDLGRKEEEKQTESCVHKQKHLTGCTKL